MIELLQNLGVKHFIDVGGYINNFNTNLNIFNFVIFSLVGVMDSDYTGEFKIVLFNHSEQEVFIKRGHRIAHLICEKNVSRCK